MYFDFTGLPRAEQCADPDIKRFYNALTEKDREWLRGMHISWQCQGFCDAPEKCPWRELT
jgi:hypothetical protein